MLPCMYTLWLLSRWPLCTWGSVLFPQLPRLPGCCHRLGCCGCFPLALVQMGDWLFPYMPWLLGSCHCMGMHAHVYILVHLDNNRMPPHRSRKMMTVFVANCALTVKLIHVSSPVVI